MHILLGGTLAPNTRKQYQKNTESDPVKPLKFSYLVRAVLLFTISRLPK